MSRDCPERDSQLPRDVYEQTSHNRGGGADYYLPRRTAARHVCYIVGTRTQRLRIDSDDLV